MSNDALELPVTSEKKTVELCGDQLHKGVHCILPVGHDGDHEFQSPYATGAITWKQRPQ